MTKILFHCRTLDAYIYCKIVTTQGKYNYEPTAYGFQKDSPFLPLFNYFLNEMKEKGMVKQIIGKYEPPPQICPDCSGMLKNVDLNGDGEIDFEEFYAAMKKDSITVTEELEEAFKVFDKDNDGFISPEELRSTMESMGETVSKEEIDAMIEKADLNGDGKISICEFVKIYSD